LIAQLERLSAAGEGAPRGAPGAQVVTNRSKLGPELLGAGISCGLTIVSGVGLFAGAALEVPTGGASTFLAVASWTGFGMNVIQCGNGLARVAAIYDDPSDDTLERWDANAIYSGTILLVDAVGIFTAVTSFPFAAKNLWAVLTRESALEKAGLTIDKLRSMNRVERLRALTRAFNEASRTPEGRAALIKATKEAKIGADPLKRTSGISVRHADTLRKIVTDETVRRVSSSLREVAGSVLGVSASATPSSQIGSASGSVNSFATDPKKALSFVINLIDAGAPNL
jgi:hypothetical protein